MAKQKPITGIIRLQIAAGAATPAPPVGPALGQHGINIMEFCKQFNEKTKEQQGLIIPVIITVYKDKTFSFIMKTPPAAILIKKALGIETASGEPNKTKVGKLTKAQLKEIATKKLSDLNCDSLDSAMKVIAGTARSMGVEISEE